MVAAPPRVAANGNFSRVRELGEERIIARQVIRHGSSWTRHFDYGLARIRSDFLMCVVKKIGGTYERLGEVVRIVDDHHHGHAVAMPDQMFGRGGVFAARDPIAPDPAFLEMCGGDGQHVAVPFAGGKSLPGVRGVGWRMRTAVHPNGSLGRLPGNMGVISDQLLRVAVHFLPDTQVGGSAPGVIGRMRATLILGQRQQRRVPAIAAQARRVVDRQPEIVADIRAGNALQKIFVELGRPLAGWIYLGEAWNAGQNPRQ